MWSIEWLYLCDNKSGNSNRVRLRSLRSSPEPDSKALEGWRWVLSIRTLAYPICRFVASLYWRLADHVVVDQGRQEAR